jgi:hypothetical protein
LELHRHSLVGFADGHLARELVIYVAQTSADYVASVEPPSSNHSISNARMQRPHAVTGLLAFGGLSTVGVLAVWLVFELAQGELVRPVNPDLFAIAVFFGVLFGLLLAARTMTMPVSLADRRPAEKWTRSVARCSSLC